MKKLEIIVGPESFEDVRKLIDKSGIHGVTVSMVVDGMTIKGITEVCEGVTCSSGPLQNIKIEMIVPDVIVNMLAESIARIIRKRGEAADSKIFVMSVSDGVWVNEGGTMEKAVV